MSHLHFMEEALRLSREAELHGEVPIGAVIVDGSGTIIGRGRNRREEGNPLAHAEIEAIGQAAQAIGDWRLENTTIYVTLEPCAMCAGAIVNARIPRLVYATPDPKAGFCGSLGNLVQDPRLNHRVELTTGVAEAESREMLQSFFRRLREKRRGNGEQGTGNSEV